MGGICESDGNKIERREFYEIIVSINSILDIIKGGWNIKSSEGFKKAYQNLIDNKRLKIGAIGNSNNGKSFILSNLLRIKFSPRERIKTEGMSIKYLDLEKYKNGRIILLDSAGLETHTLIEINEKLLMQYRDINISKKQTDESERELLFEKSTEKLITELFLQNYIIHNSDILLVVVGKLTYLEQKTLNRIRNIYKLKKSLFNKPNILCVIHNLINYTTVDEVESYIKGTLLKNETFELLKINSIGKRQNGVCYYEKDSYMNIYHLIFANDYSEAGKYYNGYTLSFIENLCPMNLNLEGLDIIETVKKEFKEFSKYVFENYQGEIEFDNLPNLIKLKNPKELILKKFFIDELIFSNMNENENDFEPNYNFYQTKNQIIVNIEAPGNCEIISETMLRGDFIIIKISGNKIKDENQKNFDNNHFNERKFGRFSLNIPLKLKGFTIKNEETNIKKKDGIFTLTFQLEEIKTKGVFSLKKY